MATCADCVHVEVCCSYLSTAYNKCKLATPDFKLLKNIECDECQHFKDRARFVELPCKVGDTLYSNNQFIQSARVMAIYIDGNGGMFDLEITAYNDERFLGFEKFVDKDYTFEDIGVNLFLTREEAEQALKERETNE